MNPGDFLKKIHNTVPDTSQQNPIMDRDTSVQKLTDLAGRLVIQSKAAASTTTTPEILDATIVDSLAALGEQLAKLIDVLKLKPTSIPTCHIAQWTRFRTPNPRPSSRQKNICYYHGRFGNMTRNCSLPCSFPTESQRGENYH